MRKESHDVQYMKWILPGILGAILMCAGDWLLGYVDPVVAVDGNADCLPSSYLLADD